MIGVNSLEERTLEMMLAGLKDEQSRYLRDQMESASVAKRTYTGCGFFTDFAVPETCSPVPGEPRFQISGVSAVTSRLQHGIGFVLFVERGRLSMLEAFTYDEPWPTDLGEITLTYLPEGDRPEIKADGR
jgi:hypothetical protein